MVSSMSKKIKKSYKAHKYNKLPYKENLIICDHCPIQFDSDIELMLNVTIARIDKDFKRQINVKEPIKQANFYTNEIEPELFRLFDEKMLSYLSDFNAPNKLSLWRLYQELKAQYYDSRRPMSFFRVLKFLNKTEEQQILKIFKGMLFDMAGASRGRDCVWEEIISLLEYY
jgi:hypothetical protein